MKNKHVVFFMDQRQADAVAGMDGKERWSVGWYWCQVDNEGRRISTPVGSFETFSAANRSAMKQLGNSQDLTLEWMLEAGLVGRVGVGHGL